MRLSEFAAAVASAFGADYAPRLLKELSLTKLDSLTANEALDKGIAPRDVWHALCDEMGVPERIRAGTDPQALIPPRR